MIITNVTDYDNMVDAYNNSLSMSTCTTNDYNIDLIIPSLLLTIPCGISFLFNIPYGICFNQTFIQ